MFRRRRRSSPLAALSPAVSSLPSIILAFPAGVTVSVT